MSECSFPTCTRIPEHNGYCFLHKIYSSVPQPPKVKKEIPKVSEKRKEQDKQYKKVKKEILGKDARCKVKSPVCTGKAQGLNHDQKRTPGNYTNVNNLTPCCNACNLYIEEHSAWALENGHTISKFATIKQ
jgi:hypothetical protein